MADGAQHNEEVPDAMGVAKFRLMIQHIEQDADRIADPADIEPEKTRRGNLRPELVIFQHADSTHDQIEAYLKYLDATRIQQIDQQADDTERPDECQHQRAVAVA